MVTLYCSLPVIHRDTYIMLAHTGLYAAWWETIVIVIVALVN